MAAIAHLGTGLLGAAMVERHLARGEPVVVWNRTASKAKALEAKGARAAATIAEAVKDADEVHIALSDDAAVDAILPEIAAAIEPGALVVDHTTTSASGTRERYAWMERANIEFLHAPVFMSPAMAREAKGMILTSGSRERCERAGLLLAPMTGNVWYVGERVEDAAAYKLFGNAMILVITGGIADVFAMARGMGLEPADAMRVFERLIPGVHARGARVAKGDFEPSFELTMARKDLRLALEAADASGLPLAVLPGLARRFDEVIAAGYGAADYGVIAREAVLGLTPPGPAREERAAPAEHDPFEQLERCHRRLEERLAELARAPSDPDARARFFQFLDRSIRRHEDDEEESLFPRLAATAELLPTIDSLRDQHMAQALLQRALREATEEDAAKRALVALTEAYRVHVETEERALFPAARVALDAATKRVIAGEMQARRGHDGESRGERERGGGGGGRGGGGGGGGGRGGRGSG